MFKKDIHELIQSRISCRSFKKQNLSEIQIIELKKTIAQLPEPPFKSSIRFLIVAAQQNDMNQMKKLGTYGSIKNPNAFIIGVCEDTKEALVDFGFLMELLVLKVEELNLGSCWLGGSFQKSRFAECASCTEEEIVPSVIAVGVPMENPTMMDRFIRLNAKSRKRKNWDALFFINDLHTPLSKEHENSIIDSLEMLRIAPSASNKQPWRVVLEEETNAYHFILQRIGNYHKAFNLLKLPDLQKVDLGIAMAHFDKSAQSRNRKGIWKRISLEHIELTENDEYIMSWFINE